MINKSSWYFQSLESGANYICRISRKRLMLRIRVIMGQNDVMRISEGLKKIGVGGLTVSKMRGRGKKPGPEIHASKGSEIFTPQFSDKYVIELIIADSKEEDAINTIRQNARAGKIFVSPVSRAIDISTGEEGDKTI